MVFVKNINLADQIAKHLTDKIVKMELLPGERIMEAKVASDLKVSRSPVREALRILEKNYLVELIPNKGAKVTELTESFVEWLYDILIELYALLARKAVEKYNLENIRPLLYTALQKLEKAAEQEDVLTYFNAIFEFASIGFIAAKNPLLENILLELLPNTQRIQFVSLTMRKDDLRKNVFYFKHATLYMDEGNIKKIEEVLREFGQNEKDIALKIVREYKLKEGMF
ncbi:MAG: GntR family transcriptional regulator [Desulfobacterales bacterium]|nr:GntR family transcriptional regulator [Desulfobacterales bacterium]MBF0397149.1 GntR family transcriptional regulator [Desulfobacterales bacterium]